jgi:hypothetical protein
MAYLTGILLGLVTGVFTRLAGFDRDRALYPVILVVVGSYYVLFAVMGESAPAIVIESMIGIVFASIAVIGFRTSLWLIVAGLAGHGLFDSVHGQLVSNPGVPPFWPAFCGTIDVVLAGWLAWMLRTAGVRGQESGIREGKGAAALRASGPS